MSQAKVVFAVTLVVLLALAVRLPGLGEFMTVDEEQWMLRSGSFWHQLFREGNAGGTFMGTHPGATVMWLIGSGVAWQEARLGFDIDTSNLEYFRTAATVPMVLATSALIGFAVWLLGRLRNLRVALAAGVVLAADPYLTGMSQIAHLDALLALLMLSAVLAFLLASGGRVSSTWRWLFVSGILAGLAMATKLLPALWLFVFFGVVLTVRYWRELPRVLIAIIGKMFFVGVIAFVVFVVVWPAALTEADFQLGYLARDTATIIADEHVALSISAEPIEPASFYGRTVLGRTTPFVLIMVVGMIVGGVRSWRERRQMPLFMWLVLYAVGYLVLITFVAKKADRYALPALAALMVVAGWGFGLALEAWERRRAGKHPVLTEKYRVVRRPAALVFVVVTVALVAQTLLWSPYAIAYNSPFFPDIRPMSQQGWGEGLDKAARWLNGHPLVKKLYIASWYPGVTGTYFNGKTMSLSSRDDHRVGFVVLYRNMAGRAPDDVASNILDEFRDKVPEQVIFVQGRPYAWIYERLGPSYFSQHVGELVGEMEVGQSVPVNVDNWSGIEIVMATFSSRENTEDVILHIRESIDATEDIRTVVVSASVIEDEAWQRFEFESIAGSQGKTYYAALTSPESMPGNAITARFVMEDVLPGQFVLRRRTLEVGEKNSDFIRAGDLAYRIPQ